MAVARTRQVGAGALGSGRENGAAVDAINTLRAILAGGAVLAALVAAMTGLWMTVAILVLGVAGHVWLWVRLHRDRSGVPPAGVASRPLH